jgi:hypothetical protein
MAKALNVCYGGSDVLLGTKENQAPICYRSKFQAAHIVDVDTNECVSSDTFDKCWVTILLICHHNTSPDIAMKIEELGQIRLTELLIKGIVNCPFGWSVSGKGKHTKTATLHSTMLTAAFSGSYRRSDEPCSEPPTDQELTNC